MQRHNTKSEEIESTLSVNRQREVRKFAADHFHQQLLQNPAALNYQMQVRGHSLKVLQRFWVGVACGDILGKGTQKGFSAEELVAVGLVKKNKNGYRPYIPNGFFVYPHWSRGEILFFTLKDPGKKKKFQLPKKFADLEWICMNQMI